MGRGFDLIVVDDPYKRLSDLDSPLIREGIQEFFDTNLQTRLQPNASIIVIHTRYSPEDLIGVLKSRDDSKPQALKMGWEYINVPAISYVTQPDGTVVEKALWPEFWPLGSLKQKEAAIGDYAFSAMYMGMPRPRGKSVFNNAHYYEPHEFESAKIVATSIGIDCAYTNKSYSDYCVALTMHKTADGCIYITDMFRKQTDITSFAVNLRALKQTNPNATIFWFMGPAERPALDLLKTLRVFVRYEKSAANSDKYAKAVAVAAMWNQGRIKIPINAEWREDFMNEVLSFTGQGDRHDDIVDALASGHWPLFGKSISRGVGQKPIGLF